MLDQFMEQLAADLALKLTAAKRGEYTLPLDSAREITIRQGEQVIELQASVGECPQQNTEEFYRYAMLGNLMGLGTGGAVLSLDPTGKQLSLQATMPLSLPYNQFKDQLEDFANHVDYWKEQITEHRNDPRKGWF